MQQNRSYCLFYCTHSSSLSKPGAYITHESAGGSLGDPGVLRLWELLKHKQRFGAVKTQTHRFYLFVNMTEEDLFRSSGTSVTEQLSSLAKA